MIKHQIETRKIIFKLQFWVTAFVVIVDMKAGSSCVLIKKVRFMFEFETLEVVSSYFLQ